MEKIIYSGTAGHVFIGNAFDIFMNSWNGASLISQNPNNSSRTKNYLYNLCLENVALQYKHHEDPNYCDEYGSFPDKDIVSITAFGNKEDIGEVEKRILAFVVKDINSVRT